MTKNVYCACDCKTEDSVELLSSEDMSTEIPDGLIIGAVTERKDPHDVLISKGNSTLRDLPQNAKIGTSSLRRIAQLLAYRSDLEIVDLRGNLDTR